MDCREALPLAARCAIRRGLRTECGVGRRSPIPENAAIWCRWIARSAARVVSVRHGRLSPRHGVVHARDANCPSAASYRGCWSGMHLAARSGVASSIQGTTATVEVPMRFALLIIVASGLAAGSMACDAPRLTTSDVPTMALRDATVGPPAPLVFLDGNRLQPGSGLDHVRASDIARA